MTNPIHISVDTETWGKRAGCDGRSIGACIIDPKTGFVPTKDQMINGVNQTFYINLDNPLMGSYSPSHYTPKELDKIGWGHRRYYLARDPDTVDWWYDEKQAEANTAFTDRVDLKDALIQFNTWLHALGVDPGDEHSCRIWGHGAAYDPPIIDAWYAATKVPCGWHYRAPRDTRTAFDMVDISDHSKWIKQFRSGVFHHALDDSMTQGRAIVAAYGLRMS